MQFKRILVFGNSGSGKTSIIKNLVGNFRPTDKSDRSVFDIECHTIDDKSITV